VICWISVLRLGTYLVDVRRGNLAGGDKWIETLYDKLRTLESDEGAGWGAEGQQPCES
jgi:hypothetical protein